MKVDYRILLPSAEEIKASPMSTVCLASSGDEPSSGFTSTCGMREREREGGRKGEREKEGEGGGRVEEAHPSITNSTITDGTRHMRAVDL